MDICLEHLLQHEREGDEYSDCNVKGDKSWCLYHDPETKYTSQQWQHSSHPPPSAGKVMPMPTLFISHCGPLLIDWLPKGITVNADCHSETLRVLEEHIKAKRPGMLMRVIILFHDPNLQEPVMRSCNSFNGSSSTSPLQSRFLPLWQSCVWANEKANKGQHFATGGDVQEAITSWFHW
jgi:hypothetical protein